MGQLFDMKLLGARLLSHKNRLNKVTLSVRKFSKDADKWTVNVPSKQQVTPLPPLSQPIAGLPEPQYVTGRQTGHTQTEVTTLSNGLRVASEKKFGQFCTVGVVIDSGSRYEVDPSTAGVSHFLEKLAFGATAKFESRDHVLRELERRGGICDCQGARDTTVYAASADSRGLRAVTEVLGEVVLRPRLASEEIAAARQAVAFELEALHSRPEQDTLLTDMIHKAAYGAETLGRPKLCPEENITAIGQPALLRHLATHYTPERMVVAAVGVEHSALVEAVQQSFVESGASAEWPRDAPPADATRSRYSGGLVTEDCDIPLYPGSDLPELSHLVLGLESCSHADDDFVAVCVLNMMMGGGGSFSAGGPGKGMYTRLYTNVLNRYHWMFSATAYNHAYTDTGLWCVHASAPPARVRAAALALCRELAAMAQPPARAELDRARTQLQSMLLMNLEARPVCFEDVARQVLATGGRKPPQYFIDAIERVTPEDIVRVAGRLLASPLSVAARGRLQDMPSMEEMRDALAGKPDRHRLSLFRS